MAAEADSMTPRSKHAGVTLLMFAVLVLGSANSFSSRIRAELLGKYDGVVGGTLNPAVNLLFFVVLLSFKGYRQGYGLLGVFQLLRRSLQGRDRIGKMLLVAGLCDEFGIAITATTQPYLTTLLFSIINQAISPFAALWSMLLLGKRYTALETGGLLLVLLAVAGSILCGGGRTQQQTVDLGSAIATFCSTLCPALSYVLKEKACLDYSRMYGCDDVQAESLHRARGPRTALNPSLPRVIPSFPASLDVKVMGVMVYFAMSIASIPIVLSIEYLRNGHAVESFGAGFQHLWMCPGAMTTCGVYAAIDVTHNFCLQLLVAHGSALLTFLSMKLALPLNALLSPLPWPVIGPKEVPTSQWFFLLFIILGVAAFRYGNIQAERGGPHQCCFPCMNHEH